MAPLQTPEQRAKELREVRKQAAIKRDAAFIQGVRERTVEEKRLKALEELEKERLKQERLLLKAKKEAEYKLNNHELIQDYQRKKREAQQAQQLTAPEPVDVPVVPPVSGFPAQPLSPLTDPDSLPAARPFTPPRRAASEIPQAPVFPAFQPEVQFEHHVEAAEAVISPTRPPINVPVLETPPRRRRRIKPTLVGPVSPVLTTAEQRARAAAWNADTFGQRPNADPVPSAKEQRAKARAWNANTFGERPALHKHNFTEAELEQMLQPTPSPPRQSQKQEDERKMTAQEQEEELERERIPTPVLSVNTVLFRPMTPEAGEMPEQYDYLQRCEDIIIDWAIAMVPAASLRVADALLPLLIRKQLISELLLIHF
jgi:hypothetical protein